MGAVNDALSLGALLEGFERIQTGRYAIFAFYTLLFYDWILQLADEVELVHRSRWSMVKTLYLICRYYPLLAWPLFIWAWVFMFDRNTCIAVVRFLYIAAIPLLIFPQAIFVLRAVAFTGHNKIVMWIMIILYTSYVAGNVWVFGFETRANGTELYDTFHSIGKGLGCSRTYSDGRLSLRTGIMYTLGFVIDTFCIVIIGIHCIISRSVQCQLGKAFVLQGAYAFVGTSASNLLAMVFYLRPYPIFSAVSIPVVLLSSNILACRLILIIRRRASPTDSKVAEENSRMVREAFEQSTEPPPNPDPSQESAV
ncbi:hypothetical protein BDN72DRAFT_179166 [Pluteus cervinus]|uniref:Uncharacterized protein n=1 Tax=Pluteus cervinus TaxID=181527 RepID=A0ACD3AJH8_9AGAR|nr:hypothetical protein BDN72DRAFT_179166 [Pluteus cervinus]